MLGAFPLSSVPLSGARIIASVEISGTVTGIAQTAAGAFTHTAQIAGSVTGLAQTAYGTIGGGAFILAFELDGCATFLALNDGYTEASAAAGSWSEESAASGSWSEDADPDGDWIRSC